MASQQAPLIGTGVPAIDELHGTTDPADTVLPFLATFTSLTPRKVIRLVIIIAAYMIIRKVIVQFTAAKQKRDLERESERSKEEADKKGDHKAWTVRDFKNSNRAYLEKMKERKAKGGGKGKSELGGGEAEDEEGLSDTDEHSDSDGDEGRGTGAAVGEWGQSAWRRQRKAAGKARRALEERYKDEDSDVEIEEFLVDK